MDNSLTTAQLSSKSTTTSASSNVTSKPSTTSISSTTASQAYKRGNLIAYLSSEDPSMAKDQFAINSKIAFDFQNFHPDSKKFQWVVKKGFNVEDTQETIDPQYQFDFAISGNYDIFTTSYAQDSTAALTKAQKRFIIGENCPADALEILVSGFLVIGQTTVTFNLENSSDFSSIVWKVTLPSQRVIESESPTIRVDFAEKGIAVVEVSAIHTESGCSNYRKKEFTVSENSGPYFRSVRLVDSEGNLIVATLENNNIYKYARPADGSSVFLSLDIQNANTCTLNRNPISCSGRINITSRCADSSGNIVQCDEDCTRWRISASYQGLSKEKSYYHYCSLNDCFFGPTAFQPNHHACSESPPPLQPECGTGGSNCAGDGRNHAGGCCDIGVFHGHPADTATEWKWTCKRSLQDDSANVDCSAQKSNTPTTQQIVPSTTTHIPRLVPQCTAGSSNCAGHGRNDAAGCCSVGVFHPHPADTATEWKWTCKRSLSDNSERASCSAAKPPAPQCGFGGMNCAGDGSNYAGGCCDIGVFHGHPADTSTEWKWTCKRSLSDNSERASCSAAKPSSCSGSKYPSQSVCQSGLPSNQKCYQIGQCWQRRTSAPTPTCAEGSSNCAGHGRNHAAGCCAVGIFHSHPADTSTEWKWTCKRSSGDNSDKDSCSKTKPPAPQCGFGGSNCAGDGRNHAGGCCDIGVFHGHPADTATEWKWTCKRSLSDNSERISCSAQK